MFKVSESQKEYRFGNSGPKYLMRGPRAGIGVVLFQPKDDFPEHYHNHMEENFLVLEGKIDIYVDDEKHICEEGDMLHVEPKERHYLINPYDEPVKLVFVLSPFVDGDKVEIKDSKYRK